MRAKKGFKEAGSLRKDELERAIENREWLKAKMKETYGNGIKDNNGKNGNQIRLMGTIDFVLDGISEMQSLYDVKSVGVMKLEKDKKNRIGDFSATHLRAYINIRRGGSNEL